MADWDVLPRLPTSATLCAASGRLECRLLRSGRAPIAPSARTEHPTGRPDNRAIAADKHANWATFDI